MKFYLVSLRYFIDLNAFTMMSRLSIFALCLPVLLAGCLGSSGDDGSSDEDTTGNGGSSSISQIASYDEADIPGFIPGSSSVLEPVATNAGLYMQIYNSDSDKREILKVHGNPYFDDWSSSGEIDGLEDWVPSNVYSEQDYEVSFYWVRNDYTAEAPIVGEWGMYNANNGSPSFQTDDDLQIRRISAGSISGMFSNPWVIARGYIGNWCMPLAESEQKFVNCAEDTNYLFQEAAIQGGNMTSDMFYETPDDTFTFSNNPGEAMLSHPEQPIIYIVKGDTLYAFSSSALSWQVSFPEAGDFEYSVGDIFWNDGYIWLSYGNNIYRINVGSKSATKFMTTTGALGIYGLSGNFCIKNGYILTASGLAKSISDGHTESWLASGSLSSEDQLNVTLLGSQIGGRGIFCSPNNSSTGVYTTTSDGKVRMVFALLDGE